MKNTVLDLFPILAGLPIGSEEIGALRRRRRVQGYGSRSGGKTPAEAYRGDPPADMMDKPLRALPTYPQAQQRRQEDRSKEILAR